MSLDILFTLAPDAIAASRLTSLFMDNVLG